MWIELKPKAGCGAGGSRRDQGKVRISTYAHGGKNKAGAESTQLAVSVGAEVMRDLRWVIGDKCNIFVDRDTKQLLLARNPEGRASLGPATSNKGSSERLKGKTVCANIKFNVADDIVAWIGTPHNAPHRITTDGLVIMTNGKVV
jgi:hypothetical protein